MQATRNPTANQTPDPGQAGTDPVTGASNTGHSSTSLSASGPGESFTASCLWTGFQSVAGIVLSVTLKVDWSQTGILSGAGSKSNRFQVEYSLNNGSTWNTLFVHVGITSPSSGSNQVILSSAQNLTQVQVRDTLIVNANDPGTDAELTASVSNIRLEVTYADPQPVFIG
jgi:hypothetical protein